MSLYLWIALGSALGGVARFALNGLVAARMGEAFPWGTLLINVSGSFAIGFFNAFTARDGRWAVGEEGRMFFMVGICGGYTTFSAFSLQSLNLARSGEWGRASAYIAASVVLCLAAVWIGQAAASLLRVSRSS